MTSPATNPADAPVDPLRSRIMAAVRGKDTKPEMRVRRHLHAAGLRFSLHRKDLPGTPDIVLPRHSAVVLVHGCFWHGHGCPKSRLPATRTEWWRAKIARNKRRDANSAEWLEALGWRVFEVWECGLKDPQALDALVEAIRSAPPGSLPGGGAGVHDGAGGTHRRAGVEDLVEA